MYRGLWHCTGDKDQDHPQEIEIQKGKGKWLSEEALQRAGKRRQGKSKGEKKSYTQLNAEFQRRARTDKEAFLRHQCKEIEENNRVGKTRDLFKKIRDTKGTFHTKMGSIKDINCMDLTEAEDIKKRWQEYTKELYKKDLHDLNNNNDVITHLEPDILECEVKWALESITTNKASGSDGIQVELFQILKDDAVKVLHSVCQQIWKTQQWPQDWKRSVFIPIPKKDNGKKCSNCWEGLGAGGEGDDRGWDSWMASLTRWTWVWVNGSWWGTGRPGVLGFMGSQRAGHDWATDLIWFVLEICKKHRSWPFFHTQNCKRWWIC